MAAAERITFADFQERFKTEEQCRDYLFQQRFPNGFECPSCGAKEYYPIYRRNLCRCKKCRKQTSVTAGTVMHRTHLSLVLWFWAIYLCVNDKRGISASQLSKMLEMGYESAWYLLKRIRKAMGQRDANYLLSGLMEMDEGFFGGRKPGKRGRGTAQKKVVIALSKVSGKGIPMYLRMQEVPDLKRKTLQEFVDAHVEQGATVECDGFQAYPGLKNVAVDAKVYDCASGDLKWLHKALSNLKVFLTGTFHGRCALLQSYLDEYCFRFNRRRTPDQLFARLARAVAASAVAD